MNSWIKLNYHTRKIGFGLPANLNASVFEPLPVSAAMDPQAVVDDALDNPIEDCYIEQFASAKTVAIAINDKTRPVPHHYLLPPLLSRLAAIGIQKKNTHLLVATGTHLPLSEMELHAILPEEIINSYPVSSHNCDDEQNLEYLGVTQRGTPIFINRTFFQADLKIVLGNIEPHHFMGFSGGAKSASIGLTGRKTINHNHAMLADPGVKIGEFNKNPMRQDVEEIGQRIGVDYALNTILNEEKAIVKVLAGKPLPVMLAGIPISMKYCQVEVPHPFDIVIASVGGYPKDINLYQSQKAMTHASLLVRQGGIIILAAACPEGIGSHAFEVFMEDVTTFQQVYKKFSRLGFQVGPHKAFQIARIAQHAKIFLVSDMQPDEVKKLLLTPFQSIDEALKQALTLSPCPPSIAIMPRATNTIPLLPL